MDVSGENWLQAQYSVLGSALIDEKVLPKIMAETSESDFSGTCLTLYKTIRELFLAGAPVDPVSVVGKVGKQYTDFVMQLMAITPTAANIANYITLCRSQSRVLALQEIGKKLANADKEEDCRKLMDKANSLLVDKKGVNITTMAVGLKRFAGRSTKPKSYLTWPIASLNNDMYSEAGDFILLGGYPSAGKSALALQCALHWAKCRRVGFYSLETSADKLMDRIIAYAADIPLSDIKRNRLQEKDWERFASTSTALSELPLDLIPASGMTPADVKATAMARRHEIVIIDYLQLLTASGKNRYEQVTNISLALHTMAQTMGITVLALSQLSRPEKTSSGEERAPSMSHMRESGQIEQDADAILLLYLQEPDNRSGPRTLKIAKNKEGICTANTLEFDGAKQRFYKADSGKFPSAQPTATGKQTRRGNARNGQVQMSELPGDYKVPF